MNNELICEDCIFWHQVIDEDYDFELDQTTIISNLGHCGSTKFKYKPMSRIILDDEFCYWDAESYGAGFLTGRKFGCVHYESK